MSVEMLVAEADKLIRYLVGYVSADPDDVLVHHEARVAGTSNTPDWIVEDRKTFGVFCYGDHKNLALSGPFTLTSAEERQMERYLKMDRPLFVFDGIEFVIFHKTLDDPTRLALIPKPLNPDNEWSACEINSAIEYQLRGLIRSPGFHSWTEAKLVEILAARARIISDTLLGLLQRPRGSGEAIADNTLIDALQDLKEFIGEHHDPTLRRDDACADFIAQVIVFGLFFAHTQTSQPGDTPEERLCVINSYWSDGFLNDAKRLAPFAAIFDSLEDNLATGNDLAYWYKDLSGVLAHAEYMGSDSGPTDYHVLYEQFLKAFDNEQRFDRGAFYTPAVLADWTVRMTDALVKSHFGAHMTSVADRIVDPCCGTGWVS